MGYQVHPDVDLRPSPAKDPILQALSPAEFSQGTTWWLSASYLHISCTGVDPGDGQFRGACSRLSRIYSLAPFAPGAQTYQASQIESTAGLSSDHSRPERSYNGIDTGEMLNAALSVHFTLSLGQT